ncbi:MAG: transmembrane prediction [Bacteroidetes bacterium OLB11]|nr:MAG: transmembrane prediction [Bacteroidetes bacterium OLB11]
MQSLAQKMKLGLLVYGGGGDWYANPTALKNLALFSNQNLKTNFDLQEAQVEVGSREILNYPILFATGHGRIMFSDAEAQNLRTYLMAGGFLHIDDNYGLDKFIRPAMKKVFPELDFVEIPFNHKIYHQKFDFPNGLPKIHEHDNKPPKGFGLIYQGRLVCFYTYETDLNDGWEDPEVHKDPEEKRQQALKMGANIIQYAFMEK